MKRGALYATLTKAALHRRVSLSLRAVVWAMACFLVWCIAWFAADNLLNLSPALRRFFLTASALLLGGGIIALYRRYWRRRPDPRQTAVYLERRYGITDNSLVNAVCFDQDPEAPAFVRDHLHTQAEARCGGIRFNTIWRQARFGTAFKGLAVGVVLLLLYAIPFGSHATNAFRRFLDPSTSLMPLLATQFEVAPGDREVSEGERCTIRVKAHRSDRTVNALDILIQGGAAAPILYPMHAKGDDAFVFELTAQAGSTRYAIRHGRDQSRWYTLTTLPRPKTDRLAITVTPPAYTAREAYPLAADKRGCAVLKGSTVALDATRLNVPKLTFYAGDGDGVTSNRFSQVIERSTTLSLDLTDRRNFIHTRAWSCAVEATPDQPPAIRFLNRERNVEKKMGATLDVEVELGDDIGLQAWELFLRGPDGDRVLRRYTFRENRTNRTERCLLPVSGEIFTRNATYKLWARSFDNHPDRQMSVSPTPLVLYVEDELAGGSGTGEESPYVRLFTQLAEALSRQKTTRDWLTPLVDGANAPTLADELTQRQTGVHLCLTQSVALAQGLFKTQRIKQGLLNQITELHARHAFPLLKRIGTMKGIAAGEPMRKALNTVLLDQGRIIAMLRQILGEVDQARERDVQRQDALAREEQDQKLIEKLTLLQKEMADFSEDQKRILDKLEAIDKKAPEDWTEEEEKLLGDLAARQQEWAKFFQAAFNDLSKIENQDFSNSAMADEFIELIEELQKSGAALEKRHIEIATVNEELMGQQAESITANLERWLADAKDFIKWNGEEAGITPDVPLQDLPEELTDIIGELIDNAEEMEDVEDSTNSSLSAFDDGIGWGVSDGNMDSMAARGITGNVLPNNNEVGGRSGEGRSGKSRGQFVEKEAHGKGGRDTPTRLVQSPFEKGTVKDFSKDPQGGATGGGKQSGVGGEGLRGITPDQKTDTQQRLPGQQAEMKQKAEALMRELTVRNLPTGDLEAAIQAMEMIQKYRSTGQGLQLRQVQSELVSRLKDTRTVLTADRAANTAERQAAGKRAAAVRHHETGEKTPNGYEESVDAYFRRLAEDVE
ncbi:MAG: hypothetical protein J6334_00355 [Kiritimatiellae bacterium]|nr:hypothetical protein [Kiritimatiellia bacterium]